MQTKVLKDQRWLSYQLSFVQINSSFKSRFLELISANFASLNCIRFYVKFLFFSNAAA